MKKILLSIFVILSVSITAKAQCYLNISDVSVEITNYVPSGPNCTITLNLQFNLDYNSGAKFVYLNSYLSSDYASLAITNPLDFQCGNPNQTPARNAPDAGRLGTTINQTGKSFFDLGMDLTSGHGAVGVPQATTVLTTYSQDATVALNTPANSGGFTVTRTLLTSGGSIDRFNIQGLTLTIPVSCGSSIGVSTDVWASNANSSSAKAQCYVCDVQQYFNDPDIQGIVPCFNPRRINFALSSIRTNTTFNYRIFQDDGDNVFEPGTDDIDVTIGTPTVTTDGSGNVGLATYSIVQPPAGSTLKNYWVRVIQVGQSTGVAELLKPIPGTECAPLPVEFKSFTATRNRSSVLLKWETSSELNNSGFAVERNLNGTWEQIAFVNSQAANGNSDALLTYTYSDLNNAKGITQYRIKQVDFDNKSKYTEIRSVRGLDQIGKVTVYPNPTSNGTVNVVFDDASVVRTISVMDMSGRTLKQINNVSNNNITIDNLQPGMYTLRILVPETGEQTVQKIVVNKR